MDILAPYAIAPPFGAGALVSTAPDYLEDVLAGWLAGALGVAVYPYAIPEGTTGFPVLVFSILEGDDIYLLSGASSMTWARIAFDAVSDLYSDCASLLLRLRGVMLPFRGSLGTVRIEGITVHRPSGAYSPRGFTEPGMYRDTGEYTVFFKP